MSLKLGQITTLVISSASAAKQVLQKQDLAFCSHRSILNAPHAQHHYEYSISFMPIVTQWRILRKILNSNISSGRSLDSSEYLRSEKVKELVALCRKAGLSNDYVDIGRATFETSLNLISNIVFSKDLTDPYEDSGKEFKELVV
ncbi:putative geraniol 8-hydroxylase [Helianthus anomalus]